MSNINISPLCATLDALFTLPQETAQQKYLKISFIRTGLSELAELTEENKHIFNKMIYSAKSLNQLLKVYDSLVKVFEMTTPC